MAGVAALADRTTADHESFDHEFAGHEFADHEFGAVIGAGTQVRERHRQDHSQQRAEPGGVVRLAEIRAAGLVRQASERVDRGVERSLPVMAALRPLLPSGALRRGGTIALAPHESSSLLFTLLAEATVAGSWCAAVGLPHLGMVAAAEVGVAIARCALVPYPGPEWPSVVAALLDGVDLVVVSPPGPVAAQVASRLTARARQRGGVLIAVGRWPGADLTLDVVASTWHGLGQGRGRLRRRELEVVAHGRGVATRARRLRLTLRGVDMRPGSGLDAAGLSSEPDSGLRSGAQLVDIEDTRTAATAAA